MIALTVAGTGNNTHSYIYIIIMHVTRCLNNQKNVPLHLTMSLGRGGEACIYTVPTDRDLVAKIYHKPSDQYARKLEVMLAYPPENPTASLGHISIAWPTELVRSLDDNNIVAGFLMPRIRGMRPIIDFYNPRTRRQHCPLFNYQYLLRTARNLAAAFGALHASGYCIGDVNESNILVSDTALVTLVDTDSFQVSDPENNSVYRCHVGKPEFTPPELQNKTFAQCDRVAAHDLFGLGVVIFQLLMEGTHPFSGIYQGVNEPPPYEARIAAGHFTYNRNRQTPYIPTPIAPAWDILHPSLQQLFISCFEEGHTNPLLRPSAQSWLLALAEAESCLQTCSTNPQHVYSDHLHKCPWCERTVRLGGRDPFPSSQAVESKEHLIPLIKPKRTTPNHGRQTAPSYAHVNYRRRTTVTPRPYPVHVLKKAQITSVIFGILGILGLGYLDIITNFTNRPYISFESQYAQQALVTPKTKNDQTSFADYYQQGREAYKNRNYDLAVDKFSRAIQIDAKKSTVYINRGNSYYNLKEYKSALADYEQALQINPDETNAYVNRGNARFALAEYSSDPDREYTLAIKDYDRSLRINPDEVEAYIRRGIVRAQVAKYSGDSQPKYRQAIADFNSAIKIESSRPEAYYQRGVVRYQMAQYSSNFEQEYEQALADMDRALELNPQLAKVHLKRGIVRYEIAQYGGSQSNTYQSQAIEDLQMAAKISLAQDDMDNYQQALSSICVVIDRKCDGLFQNK